MGKTSLAMDFARNNCKQGKSVAFFSMEMSSLQLAQRLIASVSGISLGKIRGGHVGTGENSQAEFDKLGESIETISKYPLWIDDSGGLNLLQIKSKLRRLKARTNVDLVIIDYLQLMSASNNKNAGNRVQEVSELSRGLKILAKEMDIPIIALSQLSRGVESRDDKRPMLSDLRESGSIEQDADVVMFIYRDAVYNKQIKEDRKNIAEILVSKHRNGETGSIEVFWDARFTSFKNLDGSHTRRVEK
jgi:replicative DNA helicase